MTPLDVAYSNLLQLLRAQVGGKWTKRGDKLVRFVDEGTVQHWIEMPNRPNPTRFANLYVVVPKLEHRWIDHLRRHGAFGSRFGSNPAGKSATLIFPNGLRPDKDDSPQGIVAFYLTHVAPLDTLEKVRACLLDCQATGRLMVPLYDAAKAILMSDAGLLPPLNTLEHSEVISRLREQVHLSPQKRELLNAVIDILDNQR